MNSTQIERILKKKCGDRFLGVFAKDDLPTTLPALRPLVLVCNTDVKSRPGEHWISIYIGKDDCGEFFDSFGRSPETIFERFMNKHCINWIFNSRQLQSLVSYYCGHYCVLYCLYKIKCPETSIINNFTTDTGVNDWFVHKFVCRLLS